MEERAYIKVVDYIKECISEGELQLGDKLPTERLLAERLGLSRSSVREALSSLCSMGMIERRQGSGNYLVGNINRSLKKSLELMFLLKQVDYREISQVRRAVELNAFRLAISNISDETVERMQMILDKIESSEDSEEAEIDKEFHYAILCASGNKLMISIMEVISEICEDFIRYALGGMSMETRIRISHLHKIILESLKMKDVERGYAAINEHYDLVDSEVLHIL